MQSSEGKILIVDDSVNNIELLSDILGDDYEILFATNGKKALQMVPELLPDLILLDIVMPEMDGYETIKILKTQLNTAHIPIIFISAKSETTDAIKGFQHGAVDYISKPFSVEEVKARIKIHIHNQLFIKALNSEKQQLINSTIETIKTQAVAEKTPHSEDDFFAHQRSDDSDTIPINTLPPLNSIELEKALLRTQGKQELLIRLLINFKKQNSNSIGNISTAMAQDKIGLVKELVISLKGEAVTLEATKLFAACDNLDQYLKQPQYIRFNEYLAEVNLNLQNVLNDIALLEYHLEKGQQKERNLSPPSSLTDSFPINMPELESQLMELSELLKNNNIKASKIAKNISPNLTNSLYAFYWSNVLNALSTLDFDLAQEHLQTLVIELKISI